VADHLLVELDDDALGDQVFADHLRQSFTLDMLRNRALGKAHVLAEFRR
jgi:hypothetical protein